MNIFIPYTYFIVVAFVFVCALIGAVVGYTWLLLVEFFYACKKKYAIYKAFSYINLRPIG